MENWDKYLVQDTEPNNWEQYVVQDSPQQSNKFGVSDLAGSVLGVAGAGAAAYGLYKSRLPQNVASKVAQVGRGISDIPTVINKNKSSALAQDIRNSFIQAHSDKIKEFGGKIDELSNLNPNRTISIEDTISDIVKNWDELSSTTKSALKKTPILDKFLKQVSEGKISGNPGKISLKDTQSIINHINTKIPANIRYNNLDLIDIQNNIRGSQLEAFPEMEGIRAEYRKFIEPYKQVKPYFKFNKLLNSIKNSFGGAEGKVAVESILPKNVLKKIDKFRSASNLVELPQDIPLVGRAFKSIGNALSLAPTALQVFEMWKYRKDPESAYRIAMGKDPLPPEGTKERDYLSGRIL